jgi:HlyD family secretion protein
MTRNKTLWVAISALVVGTGLYVYYILTTINANQDLEVQNNSVETAVARTGDLTITANGTGEVIPASEIGLTFDTSGVVTEVLVSVGDQVNAGDVLARMQTDKTQTELAAEIAEAELAFIQAQQKSDSLYADAELEAAQALLELEAAQVALEDLMDLELEKALALEAIAQAQDAIKDAEMMLYIYNSVPSDDAIYTAYASLLFKQAEYEEIQSELEKAERKIRGVSNDRLRKRYEDQILQLNLSLANQQIIVEDATYRLNSIADAADPLDVSVAETQLETYQAQLSHAQNELAELEIGPDPGAVAISEARLNQAQADWERLKDGPDPEEIALLSAQLETARLYLEVVQQDTTIIDLVSPIDGMVIALNLDVGDRNNPGTGGSNAETGTGGPQSEIDIFESIFFGTSTANTDSDSSLITIADLDQPLLEVYIDETDFQKAAIGYPVEVTFDALPDETFTGEIVEISPQLEMVSNVQAVPVVVRLDAASYAKPVTLPIGLNAVVDVINGQALNAVLVPVEALVEVESENYVVYVVENEDAQPRDVTIGLIDYTSVEIIDGITPGEIVAIGYGNTTGN